jgi:hypothetical protein
MNGKIFYLILIPFMILGSCVKEKEPQIENENIPLLSKELYSDDLYFEYTYNEANLLKERKTKWSYTYYSYNNDNQLVSYDMYEDLRIASSDWETAQQAMNRTDWVTPENTEISGRGTYSYSHDKLTKVTVARLPSGSKTYVTFEYDLNGRIGKKVFYYNNQPSSFIEYSYDEKGNLILETHKDIVDGNPVISITEEYEFDDKNNPYKAFKRLMLPGEYTNENNIVKRTMTLFFDVYGVDKVQVTESTYEYNLQGYPIKKNNMVRYEYI